MPQMPQATPADPRQAQNRAPQPHGRRPQARTGILNRHSGSRLVQKPTANAHKRSIRRAPQAANARRHNAVNAASLPARRSFDSARCARSAQDDRVGDIPILIGKRRQARPHFSRRKARPRGPRPASERSDASGPAGGRAPAAAAVRRQLAENTRRRSEGRCPATRFQPRVFREGGTSFFLGREPPS